MAMILHTVSAIKTEDEIVIQLQYRARTIKDLTRKEVISQSISIKRTRGKSRLIIRDKSADSLKSDNLISVTRKSSNYPKYLSKFAMSVKSDLDPSNIFNGISEIDLLLHKADSMLLTNLNEEEMKEINILTSANKDLRNKVQEVSELVKNTLIKINNSKKNRNQRETRENKLADPELESRQTKRNKLHHMIKKRRFEIENLNK